MCLNFSIGWKIFVIPVDDTEILFEKRKNLSMIGWKRNVWFP